MKNAGNNGADEILPEPPHDILGTISFAQQSEILRTFDPQSAVSEYLNLLPSRERQVLEGRYGLADGNTRTLEEIGIQIGLTRERIRQIEKDGLKKLRSLAPPENFRKAVDLVFQMIEDRGNIAEESQLVAALLGDRSQGPAGRALLFMLHVNPQFLELPANHVHRQGWSLAGFDIEFLNTLSERAVQILTEGGRPLDLSALAEKLKNHLPASELASLESGAIESYLSITKKIGRNPFGEFGLAEWSQIKPRDVGDKAYLVLSHSGKPEHYSKITEQINKHGFDDRTAHNESVHNELIKDERFVLVGRGIYGLAEWGFKPGVVSDIISQVITESGHPLSKEEIIDAVMKQRLVKRNTVIVGLSNRHKLRKTADNKYDNV